MPSAYEYKLPNYNDLPDFLKSEMSKFDVYADKAIAAGFDAVTGIGYCTYRDAPLRRNIIMKVPGDVWQNIVIVVEYDTYTEVESNSHETLIPLLFDHPQTASMQEVLSQESIKPA